MKVGLYNITFLGIWYRGKTLSVDELIEAAGEMGFDGIEFDAKRPGPSPLDVDPKERERIRRECERAGIEIPAVAANNDFSSPVAEHLEAQIVWVREQIKMTRDLGAPVLRLFFAWPGVTMVNGVASYEIARHLWDANNAHFTRVERWAIARDAFAEVAGYAQEAGITLALQNHKPLLRHYRDILDMIAEVDSPALKACLDVPLLDQQDDEEVRMAVLETGDLQVHSHFGGEFIRDADGRPVLRPIEHGRQETNYPAFVKALKEIGYDGYLTYELCHPCLERHEYQGIEFVRRHTELALEYMRSLLIANGVYTGAKVAAA